MRGGFFVGCWDSGGEVVGDVFCGGEIGEADFTGFGR